MQFAENNNVYRYIESSAKDATNVENIFTCLTRDLLMVHEQTALTTNEEEETGNDDIVHYRKRHIVPVVDLEDSEPQKEPCAC